MPDDTGRDKPLLRSPEIVVPSPRMRLGSRYSAVSGVGGANLAVLAHRYDEQLGLEPEHMES